MIKVWDILLSMYCLTSSALTKVTSAFNGGQSLVFIFHSIVDLFETVIFNLVDEGQRQQKRLDSLFICLIIEDWLSFHSTKATLYKYSLKKLGTTRTFFVSLFIPDTLEKWKGWGQTLGSKEKQKLILVNSAKKNLETQEIWISIEEFIWLTNHLNAVSVTTEQPEIFNL